MLLEVSLFVISSVSLLLSSPEEQESQAISDTSLRGKLTLSKMHRKEFQSECSEVTNKGQVG